VLPAGAAQIEIPLRQSNGLLVVRAKMDDVPEGWFLVDTGCSRCILEKSLASGLRGQDFSATGIERTEPGKIRAIPVAQFKTLAIDKVAWRDGLVLLMDLVPFSKHLGISLTGVVGVNALDAAPITLDCRASRLTIYDPTQFHPPKGQPLPMERTWGTPTLRASLEGHAGWFMLDSGGADDCQLMTSFLSQNHELYDARPRVVASLTSGIGGATPAEKISFRSLSFAGRTWTNIRANCGKTAGNTVADRRTAGTLSVEVLADARLTFDWENSHCWVQWPADETVAEAVHRLTDPASRDLAGIVPLMRAIREGRIDVVKAMLNDGANPSATAANHMTPLLTAAAKGNADMVRLLLKAGARDIEDNTGSELLSLAVQSGDLPTVQALIDGNARVNASDVFFNTPLMLAAEEDDASMVGALVKAGALVGTVNDRKQTALMLGAFYGGPHSVAALVKSGADVHARDAQGTTPLMWAALSENPESVQVLLEDGSDINAESPTGRTALMFAAQRLNPTALKLLLRHGAKVNHRDKDGKSAFDWAIAAGSTLAQDELAIYGARP
jgi:ankyrin repeat protein